VLSWSTIPHESVKVYISNRVHQIHSLLPGCEWRYVESLVNPADCTSRGVMPSALARLGLYCWVPPIVYTDPAEWGARPSSLPLSDLPEVRPVSCTARVEEVPREWFDRFSSYDRMLRVVARIYRFIDACRRNRKCPVTSLQKFKLDRATRALVTESQRIHFAVLHRELSGGRQVSSRPLARLRRVQSKSGASDTVRPMRPKLKTNVQT